MNHPSRYNLRVYGICLHDDGLLVAEEKHHDTAMRKFPGGGLEFGEGLKECLKREWMEELEVEIEVPGDIFYVNDFLIRSRFNPAEQVVALFYKVHMIGVPKVPIIEQPTDFDVVTDGYMAFRNVPHDQIHPELFTFPADQAAVRKLLAEGLLIS